MQAFGELLSDYMRRTGINDSELARTLGISRQTVFRWKQGQVARPRHRDDVLVCARRLRLSAQERDLLLLAAGFAPELSSLEESGQPAPQVASPPVAPISEGMAVSPFQGGGDPHRHRWSVIAAAAIGALALAAALMTSPALGPKRFPQARTGETLLLVAAPGSTAQPGQVDVDDAMIAALQREISGMRLAGVRAARWPATIAGAADAEAARRRAGATVLLWRTGSDPTLHLAMGIGDSGSATSAPLAADQADGGRVAALMALAEALTLRGDLAGARIFLVQALALLPADDPVHGLLLARLEDASGTATPTVRHPW